MSKFALGMQRIHRRLLLVFFNRQGTLKIFVYIANTGAANTEAATCERAIRKSEKIAIVSISCTFLDKSTVSHNDRYQATEIGEQT